MEAVQVATVTLHGVEERSGDIAISSWADVLSGSSISVYKTPDFDPKNCDTAEMYAYTADLKESGKGSFEDTAVAKAVKMQSREVPRHGVFRKRQIG